MKPRSLSIPRNYKTLNMGSLFSAVIYPILGVALVLTLVLLGAFLKGLDLVWWYAPLGLGVVALSIFLWNG